jgi:hypothetical protein
MSEEKLEESTGPMRARKSQHADSHTFPAENDELGELQGSGAGAASALERMKAEHALRHKRQHGHRSAGAGHEEDRTREH